MVAAAADALDVLANDAASVEVSLFGEAWNVAACADAGVEAEGEAVDAAVLEDVV